MLKDSLAKGDYKTVLAGTPGLGKAKAVKAKGQEVLTALGMTS
jgi:hypothetical protein